ncbi:MAG: WbqC family protein [Planctomycetota bacterium]
MILSAHQVNFLPYLGFFEKLIKSNIFILLDDVQFVHTGPLAWMNKNRIRTKDGAQYITVPVLVKGRFRQNLNEVEINRDYDWRRKILGAIKQNYIKSPFFNQIYPHLQSIFNNNYTKLIDLNITLLNFLLGYLEFEKIGVKIFYSSQLKISGKGTQRLIDFCKYFGATKYLSGIHGRDYLQQELFACQQVEIIWHEFKAKEYPQQFSPFVPNLSVIDPLFNIGKKVLDLLLP